MDQNREMITIVSILKDDEVILNDWESLAVELGISRVDIVQTRQNYIVNISPFPSLLRHIIDLWRARVGATATWASLANILENNLRCGTSAQQMRIQLDIPAAPDVIPPNHPGLPAGGIVPPGHGREVMEVARPVFTWRSLTPLNIFLQQIPSMTFDQDKMYDLTGRYKGEALILNITRDRDGAKKDSEKLKKLFRGLGYNPSLHEEFYASQPPTEKSHKLLENILTNFIDGLDDDAKSLIVFVGGHGFDDHIWATDDNPVPIFRDIIYKFDNNCEKLRGKPKLFFIQACREVTVFERDAIGAGQQLPSREEQVGNSVITDTLICQATLPGYAAWRHPELGSLFTIALCSLVMEMWHENDVENIMNHIPTKMQSLIDVDPGSRFPSSETRNIDVDPTKKIYFNL